MVKEISGTTVNDHITSLLYKEICNLLKPVAGLIAAFQGFFVKGGMGLTSFVIGAFLKNGGYVANAVQTDKALFFIEVCFIWIPVVLCVIIAVLTWFYKLDSLRSEMTEELESRRRKIANGNERCDF